MRSTNYDPAIRNTESGRRLYEIWKRIRRAGADPVFDTYPAFYRWAMSVGYCVGNHLLRRDSTIVYSPENCYWSEATHETMTDEWKAEWCKKWNETVNVIRRYFGLPEF